MQRYMTAIGSPHLHASLRRRRPRAESRGVRAGGWQDGQPWAAGDGGHGISGVLRVQRAAAGRGAPPLGEITPKRTERINSGDEDNQLRGRKGLRGLREWTFRGGIEQVDTAVRVRMRVLVREAGPRRRRTQVVQGIMAVDPQQFFKVRHAAAPPLPSLARAGWRCSFVRTRAQVGMGDIT